MGDGLNKIWHTSKESAHRPQTQTQKLTGIEVMASRAEKSMQCFNLIIYIQPNFLHGLVLIFDS
jgi:hypothetical protein